jgi:hypothetical protein
MLDSIVTWVSHTFFVVSVHYFLLFTARMSIKPEVEDEQHAGSEF